MIVIDALLLLNIFAFLALLWLLMRSLEREKVQRKIIAEQEDSLNKRAMLIARLLHEADKHGSDDRELLEEAKEITLAEPAPEQNGEL